MIGKLARLALAFAMVLAAALPTSAGTVSVGVPPGTVSATTQVYGRSKTTGAIVTAVTTNSFCPSGQTISVTLPNDTSTVTYQGSAYFQDAQGTLISVDSFDNSDAASGGSGGGSSHGGVQTIPDY